MTITVSFTASTHLDHVDGSRFTGSVPYQWQGPSGANGGFTAALVVRAVEAAVGGEVPVRSVTLHYLRTVPVGGVELAVDVVRQGRTVTSAAVEVSAGGKQVALALAQLAPPRPGGERSETSATMPAVPAPEEVEVLEPVLPFPLPIVSSVDMRVIDGDRLLQAGDVAEVSAWARTLDEDPVDREWLAQVADLLPPSLFAVVAEPFPPLTLDLTIHFRQAAPDRFVKPGGWELCRCTSNLSSDGYWVEDGMIWAPDGTVLAQSRQLALA
jgi:acyl-CoA thioesterase